MCGQDWGWGLMGLWSIPWEELSTTMASVGGSIPWVEQGSKYFQGSGLREDVTNIRCTLGSEVLGLAATS